MPAQLATYNLAPLQPGATRVGPGRGKAGRQEGGRAELGSFTATIATPASLPRLCSVALLATPSTQRAEYLRGWRVKTSPVPIKPPFFSLIKSNNYLPNALNLMDAQAEQYDQVGVCQIIERVHAPFELVHEHARDEGAGVQCVRKGGFEALPQGQTGRGHASRAVMPAAPALTVAPPGCPWHPASVPSLTPGCVCCLPQGIFVDADGNVSEGPNMNVACLLVRQGWAAGVVGAVPCCARCASCCVTLCLGCAVTF